MSTASTTTPDISNLSLQLEKERRSVGVDVYDFAVRQLLDMIENDEINIAPEYQRKFVWLADRQSEFIESVFLGIPTPSLFMATNPNSTWEVVDGVQRLSTLIHFCGNEKQRQKQPNTEHPLVLEGLEKLANFNGSTFAKLPKSIQLLFNNRPMRITTLNDRSDLKVRFDLFERLNSGGVKLQPQEIRNCVYRGPFNETLKELAKHPNFRKVVKVKASDRSNGTQEEFVLRFFAFFENYKQFDHSVDGFLNSYTEAANAAGQKTSVRSRFEETFAFLAGELPKGITRGRNLTPANLFEAVAVGTALVFAAGGVPKKGVLKKLLNDDGLKRLTSGGTNSNPMVRGRIELVRDRLQ
jgi:hypothetical protein